jgi:hypothetical protein
MSSWFHVLFVEAGCGLHRPLPDTGRVGLVHLKPTRQLQYCSRSPPVVFIGKIYIIAFSKDKVVAYPIIVNKHNRMTRRPGALAPLCSAHLAPLEKHVGIAICIRSVGCLCPAADCLSHHRARHLICRSVLRHND